MNKLPGLNTTEKQKRFLLYKKKQKKSDKDCIKDYSIKTNNYCSYGQDCIDRCILEHYIANKSLIPLSVKMEKRYLNATLSDLKFVFNESLNDKYVLNKFQKKCKSIYPLHSCDGVKIVSLHRYNFINQNKIQINLNPEYEFKDITNQNNFSNFVLYLFPYLHLITGYSLINFFKPKIKHLRKLFKLIFYFVYLWIFFMLFNALIVAITNENLESSYYFRFVEEIELPVITICWNIGLPNLDNMTINELEAYPTHPKDILKKISYLDSKSYEMKFLIPNLTESGNNAFAPEIDQCYWLHKRCIATNLKERYKRVKLGHKQDLKVFEIEIDTSKIIGENVSIFLNSNNYLTNEFEFIAKKDFHSILNYQIKHSVREDSFIYFKKPYLLFKKLIDSEEPQEQMDFYLNTARLFIKLTNKITLLIPLGMEFRKLFNLKIDEKLFLNYVHLRTLSRSIDNYNFNANFDRKLIDFEYQIIYLKRNTTIITLIPDFISSTNFKNNRSSVLNFMLILISIICTSFHISLVTFPIFFKLWLKLICIFLKNFCKFIVVFSLILTDFVELIYDALECKR